jgi:hypothetical protein
MTMRKARRQMPAQAGLPGEESGEAAMAHGSDEARRPRHETESTGLGLLSAVLARENLQQAWKRVRANKGAAGVDGLDINQTTVRLRTEWPAIREQLLSGTYRPQPVRRVTIPKPDGGERELGIPTVTDRLIQRLLRPACNQSTYQKGAPSLPRRSRDRDQGGRAPRQRRLMAARSLAPGDHRCRSRQPPKSRA